MLTEAVGEMADVAIERLENIRAKYLELAKVLAPHVPEGQRVALSSSAEAAGAAMQKYREWIQKSRASMKAPVADRDVPRSNGT